MGSWPRRFKSENKRPPQRNRRVRRAQRCRTRSTGDWFPCPSPLKADPGSWVLGNCFLDVSPTNLQAGTLFRYLQSFSVYRCPSDRTLTNPQGGKRFPVNRSYTVNATLNAKGGLVI